MTEKKHRQITGTLGACGSLGVQIERDGIVFTAAVPAGKEAFLLLYDGGTEEIAAKLPLLEQPFQGLARSVKVSGVDPKKVEYNFLVDGNVLLDPMARLVRGRGSFGDMTERGTHQVRAALLTEPYDWKADTPPDIPFEDAILYQLHVRGYTKQKNSGVRHKGTFLGLQEKIPYLKGLGINQVLLMPAYEFDEIMEEPCIGPAYAPESGAVAKRLNYWGYGKGCYYAPKQSYCAGSHPDLEFKEMVRTFHENGMEVLMQFSFPDPADVRMICDCLNWWVREYHVDGFHLMMEQGAANAVARDPFLMKTKLLAAAFHGDAAFQGTHPSRQRNLAECGDGFKICSRRLLKGDEDQLGGFLYHMKRNPGNVGVINYITAHDGFTLMDLVSYEKKHNEENGEQNRDGASCDYSWNCGAEGPTRKRTILRLRMRQMKNAFAMLFLSQGTPMILAGDEFGNSQFGNNNPYCLDSEVSWVDWSRMKANHELTDFVRELIALRQEHRILHMPEALTGSDLRSVGYPDVSCHGTRAWYETFDYTSRHVGLMYCGYYADTEEFVYSAYNFHWDPQTLALPYLPEGMKWRIELDTSDEGNEEREEQREEQPLEKLFEIPPRCVRVLVGRRAADEAGKAGQRKRTD